jgi:hypothetical protein
MSDYDTNEINIAHSTKGFTKTFKSGLCFTTLSRTTRHSSIICCDIIHRQAQFSSLFFVINTEKDNSFVNSDE